jgi:hypothetical protein
MGDLAAREHLRVPLVGPPLSFPPVGSLHRLEVGFSLQARLSKLGEINRAGQSPGSKVLEYCTVATLSPTGTHMQPHSCIPYSQRGEAAGYQARMHVPVVPPIIMKELGIIG